MPVHLLTSLITLQVSLTTPATMLDFSNLKFLAVRRLDSAELRRCAKFGQNQSKHGRDMAIFLYFQDGGRPPS